MVDVAVIGAGLAGLSCARYVQSCGYSVRVIEKSRGLGGRVATRRIGNTCFDYGARYIHNSGHHTSHLLREMHNLDDQAPLIQWPIRTCVADGNGAYQIQSQTDGYVPPTGMTAIAKYLARHLDINRQQRVQTLQPNLDNGWDIYVESQSTLFLRARAVVLAIPAPQVVPLLTPLMDLGLSSSVIDTIQAVQFDPCITVITGYPASVSLENQALGAHWDAIQFPAESTISWVHINSRNRPDIDNPSDHSKVEQPSQHTTIIVTQSSPTFARPYLDEPNKNKVGKHLIASLADQLTLPSITQPLWMQVHQWRYAFCRNPLPFPYVLTHTPDLLGCTGDWCGGHHIEDALISGTSMGKEFVKSL